MAIGHISFLAMARVALLHDGSEAAAAELAHLLSSIQPVHVSISAVDTPGIDLEELVCLIFAELFLFFLLPSRLIPSEIHPLFQDAAVFLASLGQASAAQTVG